MTYKQSIRNYFYNCPQIFASTLPIMSTYKMHKSRKCSIDAKNSRKSYKPRYNCKYNIVEMVKLIQTKSLLQYHFKILLNYYF